jgi:hypothetical protein
MAVMQPPQDIDVLADLGSLEGPLKLRHPLGSKDHVAVGAEGAFGRERGFTGRTAAGVIPSSSQPKAEGLPEAHHGPL